MIHRLLQEYEDDLKWEGTATPQETPAKLRLFIDDSEDSRMMSLTGSLYEEVPALEVRPVILTHKRLFV